MPRAIPAAIRRQALSIRPKGGDRAEGHVREVAERLAVCTATVYSLCERGEIMHLRVSNAMKVHPDDLGTFLAGQRR